MADKPTTTPDVTHYDAAYGNFADVYAAIRAATYDEDIGQSGWLTAREHDAFIAQLAVDADTSLLDVGCGSGGPTLRIARITGCTVHGVDIHDQGINNANQLAEQQGLADRATFQLVDAALCLPFDDESFDALICIDTLDNLPDRPAVLRDWNRVLKSGGRLLFTDPLVQTGEISAEEKQLRSAVGDIYFSTLEENDKFLEEAGFTVSNREDHTQVVAEMAKRWGTARAEHMDELIAIEGNETFTRNQKFYAIASRLAAEKRLSCFIYVALKS